MPYPSEQDMLYGFIMINITIPFGEDLEAVGSFFSYIIDHERAIERIYIEVYRGGSKIP